MLRNYIKIAVRNLLKYKTFSLINIFGLAIGMTVCMLIILMLADQMSYDQYHEKKDKVYRIISKRSDLPLGMATTPVPLANTLKKDYPFVEETTQLVLGVGGDAIYEEQSIVMRGYFAEPSFFNLFSYEIEKGDLGTCLLQPNSMVITSDMANKLFGNENPIGKTIQFIERGLMIIEFDFAAIESQPVNWGQFKITGVLANNNRKSHLKFDGLVSASSMQALYKEEKLEDNTDNWKGTSRAYTYVELKSTENESDLKTALNDIVLRQYADIEKLKDSQFVAQNLKKITPGMFLGNMPSLRLPKEAYYFLSFLALIVMIMACLNYINLSVARSLTRVKEIGVRKVTGAKRSNLVLQFLSESIITTFLSLFLAVSLLFLVKSGFMNLWFNRYFNFELQESLFVYFIFMVFAVFVGFLAGLFPAINLSKYQPVVVLKKIENLHPRKFGLRKVLNILQLAVSLFFIVTSILMYNQIQHFLGFEYGFTSENIINVELQGNDHIRVAHELSTISGVSTISASSYLPATGVFSSKDFKSIDNDEYVEIECLSADKYFPENLDLKIIAGTNLPESIEASGHLVLINETAAQKLGFESFTDIIGQTFIMKTDNEAVEVVGILKDFHSQSAMFSDKIGPFMIRNMPEEFIYANVKVISGDLSGTIEKIEEKWKNIDPVHPLRFSFYDDQVAALNQMLGDVLSILSFAAFLAVTIACLGLLGMAMYAIERRRKEIGIRKVLGATETKIVYILSKEYLKMLLIAILIAAPLSYFVNNAWLQNFPNKVEFGLGTILVSISFLLILGFITIGSQTFKAAISNPVNALRYE